MILIEQQVLRLQLNVLIEGIILISNVLL